MYVGGGVSIYSQIEWGTCPMSATSLGFEPADWLHLRITGFMISDGSTRPLLHACGAPVAAMRGGAAAGVGAGSCSCPLESCFLRGNIRVSYVELPTTNHQQSTIINQQVHTHFRRLLSSITHLMPSMVQLEHVTSPSGVTWYRCITSQRTLRARHAAHAFAALLLTGLAFPAVDDDGRFFELELESTDAGECGCESPDAW